MTVGLQQVSDLLKGESEPLRRLDHPQYRHRLGRGEPVAAWRAVRFGEQPAALIVPQCLPVQPGRVRDLPAAHPVHAVVPPVPTPAAAAAWPASRSSVPVFGAGTVMSRTRRSAATVM